MNKQTAVQWLIDRFMDGQVDNKMLRTALHLEKEQILEAWDNGDFCIDLPDGWTLPIIEHIFSFINC